MNTPCLYDCLFKSKSQKLYHPQPCFELIGKSFAFSFAQGGTSTLTADEVKAAFNGDQAVYCCTKCKQDSYLIGMGKKTLVFDQTSMEAILVREDGSLDTTPGVGDGADLEGWSNVFCLGPEHQIPFSISDGTLHLPGGSFPIASRKLSQGLYLLSLCSDGENLVLVIDSERYLVYGLRNTNEFVSGYLPVE